MKGLPVNLCDFRNLVKMNFSNNEIGEIDNISCLSKIEVIDLRHNRIQTINNETFRDLERLRLLNVSYNPLTTIDPYSFQLFNKRSIFNVDMRMGNLQTIDVSYIIYEKQYCEINFDGNPLEKTINPTNFQIDKDKEYGLDGRVSLKNCRLYQMINLTDIGMDKPNDYYKYLKFSIDTSGSNISCDCLFAPLLAADLQSARKFWVPLQYDNITCMSPNKLKGVKVKYLVESGDLDDMICDEPVRCPKQCHCYSQPSQNHLVINCTDAGLQTLPETLPWGNRYTLLMEGNDINSFGKRDYLKRVYKADFGNTPVQTLKADAVSMLPDDAQVYIKGGGLSHLPSSMSDKFPGNIFLGNTYIECNCDNRWLQTWVNKKFTSTHSTNIFCRNFDELRIEQLDVQLLNCEPVDTLWQTFAVAISAMLTFVIGLALLFVCYKPEIFLLYRHRILCRKHDFNKLYDVYLCFDERNEMIRKWIVRKLLPYLEENGYRVFLPCINECLGGSREQLRRFAINNSRAYVVVASDGAFKSVCSDNDSMYISPVEVSMQMEFSNILYNFKSDSTRRMAVINFDNLKTEQMDIRYIKAFFRTRESVDFTSRHCDILKIIQKKIGPPGLGN
ncbi:hypothetical protein FSP39_014426 [Pinctada imbricata]|uniref:TIR domain-containing protein n=1 Tax=Pinctada imbricata TaxID=66713 RepID=A0AA88YK64_PINIB|nr:hypothetical protein FSP39_014426 [Pinctada imbricata]